MSAALTHAHANVDQYMPADRERAAVRRVLALGADTVHLNELSDVTRAWVRESAGALGYAWAFGDGALSQLGVLWKVSVFDLTASASRKVTGGRKGVTPDRGLLRVDLRRRDSGLIQHHLCAHFTSRGWTSDDGTTRFRRRQWRRQWRALKREAIRLGRTGLVVWSADANRDDGAWRGNRPFPALGRRRRRWGWATAVVARTGPTHGGQRYDYAGLLSRPRRAVVVGALPSQIAPL